MRKWIWLCLMASLGLATTQAQTLKLPTKKKPKKEVVQEEKTPQQSQESQKPQQSQQPQESQKSQQPQQPQKPQKPLLLVSHRTVVRTKPVVARPKAEDNTIYESADHMPTFPGGAKALRQFIDDNLQYPEEALADSIQGTIQVSFVVEKDGRATAFEVIDEHHPALEAEAVRVLQLMPKWNPATHNGVRVRVEYVVPVKFKLPKK